MAFSMATSVLTLTTSFRFMKQHIILAMVFLHWSASFCQIKTIIEDFEGYADGQTEFAREGIFSYGDVHLMTEQTVTNGFGYSGMRAVRASIRKDMHFGGWGKGVGMYKELDVKTDYFNFYVLLPEYVSSEAVITLFIEDDDNGNSTFEYEEDDQWVYQVTVQPSEHWQLFSIPLREFTDANKGGDGIFNINHDEGKLLTVGFNFDNLQKLSECFDIWFNFLCFSKGVFAPENLFDPVKAGSDDYCVFGFWSEEGESGNPRDIHTAFENLYGCFKPGKIGVVSFYKPLSIDGQREPNFFPEIERINDLIERGYLPLITFEIQHKSFGQDEIQPNLYSITEGWYDHFLEEWGRTISRVNGTVLVRILHEFNGDWYPWSIANNDHDPELYIKAYRRIVNKFRSGGNGNMRFVWCPNSVSTPQEPWNYFMKAYPGDEYVDFIGLDIFNGAGQKGIPQWRSFRHEAYDAYFLITENFPHKKLLICETATRERFPEETGYYTTKADWIRTQIEALKSDMSKFRLMVWFNETPTFRIESSIESFGAFFKHVWIDDYFLEPPLRLITEE